MTTVPSDNMDKTKKRIAIVGGGVTGLSAAWHLSQNTHHEVHLFEKEDRLGGHAYTIPIHNNKKDKSNDVVDVDIGFMVFNHANYPNMTKWFETLGVQEEDSDMSLSVSLDGGKTVEWNSDGLNGLFAKRSQLWQPSFYQCMRDMIRFHAEAPALLQLLPNDPRRVVTTGQYLRDHGYSRAFLSYYLVPMMAALWSASMEEVLQFPAEQLIGFLANHKMLQLLDRPAWKTVKNRSQSYTLLMKEILGDHAHVSTPIEFIQKTKPISQDEARQGDAVSICYELFTTDKTSVGVFDDVIFACHPPTTKRLLSNVLGDDSTLLHHLKSISYADNVLYVHSDPKLMPARKRAWASWNCLGKYRLLSTLQPKSSKKGEALEGGESGFGAKSRKVHFVDDDSCNVDDHVAGRMKAVYVTYWLNRLQNLDTDQDIFVSLNPHERPDEDKTHKRLVMAHPQFTPATLQARKALEETFQGKDGLWFCGAWGGYGFHEDGCRKGFEVATKLSSVPLPWANENNSNDNPSSLQMVLPPPDHSKVSQTRGILSRAIRYLYKAFSHDIPVAVCKRFIIGFLKHAIQKGTLQLKFNDGSVVNFGDGSPCGCDNSPVTIRVFDPWFFVKTAMEYDLGLARSYMAGYFVIEPLADPKLYDPVMRPMGTKEETTVVLGDPIGLTRLFLLLIGNRDSPDNHMPRKSGRGHSYANAMSNASGLVISKIGSFFNFWRYKLTMDNSERGGSLKNIHAHYDLSNDLFTTFLDKQTLMYSSAIYDAVPAPPTQGGLLFRGTLEEAQVRKLDTLLDRAQIQPGQTMLDIGFGWGGLSLHAAKKYGCKVTGITLSVEQKALAEKRVKMEGVGHLITFEVVDYRTFARRKENRGKFDRVMSCEMIEAVGHEHLGEFFWAVEQVLAHDGILVMEAITTPEQRYETYRRSTDFINTIIFPGSCCPSLHALVDAAYQQSSLTLEHIDNIGLHYAQTLAEWRRRFNANESFVRSLGFDDVFLRVWNYYLTYCEAGFHSQTENCLILVFSRQGCKALVPLCETRSVTQMSSARMTDLEVQNWLGSE